MAAMRRSSESIVVLLAYLTFIGLGLTSGLLGLAWPSIQAEFNMPLDAAGWVLVAGTVGYLSASFITGQLSFRLGSGPMFLLGALLAMAGLFGFAGSPVWLVLIVSWLVNGFGTGLVDAGLNSYVAAHYNARSMNWLHACFGIGVTIAPLIMTAILNVEQSWRWGYAIVGGFMLLILIGYAATLRRWKRLPVRASATQTVRRVTITQTLRLPMTWIGILIFFLYTGLEATPGQWGYPLFTDVRGVAQADAGLWISVYWGSFTIGRLFFGAMANRLDQNVVLRWCLVGTVFGALLWWWNPINEVGFAGLTLFGFAQAPLFPVWILKTAERVGAVHASNAIGFQVAGAGLGVAVLPSIAGILANQTSLEIIPPLVLGAAVVMLLLNEYVALRTARMRVAAPANP